MTKQRRTPRPCGDRRRTWQPRRPRCGPTSSDAGKDAASSSLTRQGPQDRAPCPGWDAEKHLHQHPKVVAANDIKARMERTLIPEALFQPVSPPSSWHQAPCCAALLSLQFLPAYPRPHHLSPVSSFLILPFSFSQRIPRSFVTQT